MRGRRPGKTGGVISGIYTLRIFSGRERRRWSQIVRRSRRVNVGQAPSTRDWGVHVDHHGRKPSQTTQWSHAVKEPEATRRYRRHFLH